MSERVRVRVTHLEKSICSLLKSFTLLVPLNMLTLLLVPCSEVTSFTMSSNHPLFFLEGFIMFHDMITYPLWLMTSPITYSDGDSDGVRMVLRLGLGSTYLTHYLCHRRVGVIVDGYIIVVGTGYGEGRRGILLIGWC